MTALDFFLYDNRTLSPRWGRDWGLKAATGALAGRADLRAAFDRYCGAMPSEQGQLRGFGEAIGGVRSRSRGGYLLCVTLETADSFGRPSWAVYGLWCPDSATLEDVLSTGDPIGSARALLGAEIPPNAIEIRRATTAVGSTRRMRGSSPAFYRFDPGSTVREVAALLLGTVQQGHALPNVLGITATSRLAAVAQAGFDLAYCHPMDDRTERALARFLSPEDLEVISPVEPEMMPVTPPPRRPEPRAYTVSEPSSAATHQGLLWFSIGIMGVVIFLLIILVADFRSYGPAASRGPAGPVEGETTDSMDTSVPETSVPQEGSDEAVLKDLGERLEECRQLDSEELRRSSGFKTAETLEVLPEYEERRDRVRQAYSNLIEIRGRMVKRQGNYVAYYYEDTGKNAATAMKLQKVAEILGEAPLGSEDCKVLKEAFGFEFESGHSILRRWCDTVESLEKTAARIRPIPRNLLTTPPDANAKSAATPGCPPASPAHCGRSVRSAPRQRLVRAGVRHKPIAALERRQ